MTSVVARSAARNREDNAERTSVPPAVWIVLWLLALATRLGAAFYLPNAEQDGYSDAETIGRLSAALASGHFHLADLYGFWLPLFQFVSALPNIWIDNPLLCGKVVSAMCGAISCLLVFAIAHRLTTQVFLSYAVFTLVLLSPLHLLYSGACMTDVPFGCLLLASLYFVLKEQWLGATICAALAGGVRVEAWALIPLLPILQFVRERRISWWSLLILLLPPLAWLLISRLARGDWFAFFIERAVYHAHYIEFHPSRRGFAVNDVIGDIDYFLLGANRAVLLASVIAVFLVVVELARTRRLRWHVFATASFLFSIVGLLVVAYVTKRQPVWLPRYGLSAFIVGLPLLAWLLDCIITDVKPRWLGQVSAGAVLFACVWLARPQLLIIPKVLDDFQAHSTVARALVADLSRRNDDQSRCFSDDIAVHILSKLPSARFVCSPRAPRDAWNSVAVFEAFLREQQVGYLIFMPTEDSLPVKFYPELEHSPGPLNQRFEPVASASSSFGPDVSLYRLRN